MIRCRFGSKASGQTLGVLAVPFALSCLNALRVPNCNFTVGATFFLLLPVSSAVFAATIGISVHQLLAVWRRTKEKRRLVIWCIGVLSYIITLWRLYAAPAVYAFDPFGGYFPGPIYDEALRPPDALWWFRGANVLWAMCIWVVTQTLTARWRHPSSARWKMASVALIAVSVVAWTEGPARGFRSSYNHLNGVLSQVYKTKHFTLHTTPGAYPSRLDSKLALEDLAFNHHRLTQILGSAPNAAIDVYAFPSASIKKRLVGAGSTLFARPWAKQIFIQTGSFPHRRLRHELAHVFAADFGDPIFGISIDWSFPLPRVSSGLVEGLAVAAEADLPWGQSTYHQKAKHLLENGYAPAMANIVGAWGFLTAPGPRAYVMAGSFSTFLLETYGSKDMKRLYRSGGNFEEVYQTDLSSLIKRWRAYLQQQPNDAQENDGIKNGFASQPYSAVPVLERTRCALAGLTKFSTQAPTRPWHCRNPSVPQPRTNRPTACCGPGRSCPRTPTTAVKRRPSSCATLR